MPKTPTTVQIIGGQWKRTPLPVLSLPGLRPTPNRVRETLFNWLGHPLEGQHCLDLFAGTGALGFEAASRGAAQVLMVEQNTRVIQQLRLVQEKLQAHKVHIVQTEALRFIAQLPAQSLDIIFLDPPFSAIADSSPIQNKTLPSELLLRALQYASRAICDGGQIYIEAPIALNETIKATQFKYDLAINNTLNEHPSNQNRDQIAPQPVSLLLTHYKKFGAVHAHLLRCSALCTQ